MGWTKRRRKSLQLVHPREMATHHPGRIHHLHHNDERHNHHSRARSNQRAVRHLRRLLPPLLLARDVLGHRRRLLFPAHPTTHGRLWREMGLSGDIPHLHLLCDSPSSRAKLRHAGRDPLLCWWLRLHSCEHLRHGHRQSVG